MSKQVSRFTFLKSIFLAGVGLFLSGAKDWRRESVALDVNKKRISNTLKKDPRSVVYSD